MTTTKSLRRSPFYLSQNYFIFTLWAFALHKSKTYYIAEAPACPRQDLNLRHPV